MDYFIVDMEANGLIEPDEGAPVANRLWVMSVFQYIGGVGLSYSITDYEAMRIFWRTHKGATVVGHNIGRYDIPLLEKLLGFYFYVQWIDSLALSWYLFPGRFEHGLESWGSDLGIEKPAILDWQTGEIASYVHRCETDVKINNRLFRLQMDYLVELYGSLDKAMRLIGYLRFKLDCAREQEEVKLRLDIETTKKNLKFLFSERERRRVALAEIMPKDIKYKMVQRPVKMVKIDGKPTEASKKWHSLLHELGLPEYHLGTVQVIDTEEKGNPGSHVQVKQWLFSLGWIPQHLKPVKNKKTGETKMIPQITNQEGDDVCDSVKELYEKVPELENLEGLSIVNHRVGILEGYLQMVNSDGFVKSQISGLTNTLRFQHKKPIVNLPQIPKAYWKEVRECLIRPEEGWELCGTDMSGLEDNTKRHYLWYFDPEYVKEQMTPGFDSHLDIGILADLLNKEEVEFFKQYNKEREAAEIAGIPFIRPDSDKKAYGRIKGIRLKAKKTNFSAVYGAGPSKIALTANIPKSEATIFHRVYWKRNHAVKKVSDSCVTKTVRGQQWLKNPVSQLWCSLRAEKDKFSTLNQSTGVYAFDTWIRHTRNQGIKIAMQYHDEFVVPIPIEEKEILRQVLNTAIDQTNEELQLNVPLGISIDFGRSYADIH